MPRRFSELRGFFLKSRRVLFCFAQRILYKQKNAFMSDLQFEKSFISAKIVFMYCKLPIILKNPQKNFEKNRKFAKKGVAFLYFA